MAIFKKRIMSRLKFLQSIMLITQQELCLLMMKTVVIIIHLTQDAYAVGTSNKFRYNILN